VLELYKNWVSQEDDILVVGVERPLNDGHFKLNIK
jgi:hypothetical protein